MNKDLRFTLYAIKKNIQNSAELRGSFLMNIVGKTIMVVLFGEHLDDAATASAGKASRDNVVHMMAELKLIDQAQAQHLRQLGAQEFKERVQRTVA